VYAKIAFPRARTVCIIASSIIVNNRDVPIKLKRLNWYSYVDQRISNQRALFPRSELSTSAISTWQTWRSPVYVCKWIHTSYAKWCARVCEGE